MAKVFKFDENVMNMVAQIMDFQNEKLKFGQMNEQDTVEFCIKMVYEIFIEKKHHSFLI